MAGEKAAGKGKISYAEQAESSTELTVREEEIFGYAVQGERAADIANRLHLSARTVEKHLQSIYRKMGVERRMVAIRQYYERLLAERDRRLAERDEIMKELWAKIAALRQQIEDMEK